MSELLLALDLTTRGLNLLFSTVKEPLHQRASPTNWGDGDGNQNMDQEGRLQVAVLYPEVQQRDVIQLVNS